MDLKDYISGSYYSLEFIQDLIKGPLSKDKSEENKLKKEEIFYFIKNLFNEKKEETFSRINESTLEEQWIKPILERLDWSVVKGTTFNIQGKSNELDFSLFPSSDLANQFLGNTYSGEKERFKETQAFLCENKAWKVPLDNKKATLDNPHHQINHYLNQTRVRWGFLTNGHIWRLYDGEADANGKVYYEVNLLKIIKEDNLEAFGLFYYVFRNESLESSLNSYKKLDNEKREALEDSLKEILYGKDSIIEQIGKALFASLSREKGSFSLVSEDEIAEIFHDSLIFAFRLIFMAYYESRYWETLEKHISFKEYSIYSFYEKKAFSFKPERFELWEHLKNLWNSLNVGNPALSIPMLNGGLFSPEKAPNLLRSQWINNETLSHILTSMLKGSEKGNYREFKTLSVTHLGSIYEGFLEYEFRYANQTLYFARSKEGEWGYYNEIDMEEEKLDKSLATKYPKGSLYLSSFSNNRKTSASYYTPDVFTQFQAKEAIKTQEEAGKSLHELKIIDNACGSGHYLVSALAELTRRAQSNLEENSPLYQILEEEKQRIRQNLEDLSIDNPEDFMEEDQILKRLLVKRCFFGVDLSEIAVELTRLSLWIETFVFGTPLSFLEHHVKPGNSLIGLKTEDWQEFVRENTDKVGILFANPLSKILEDLKSSQERISLLRDTTLSEINESKRIYVEEILPATEKLRSIFDFLLYERFLDQIFLKDKSNSRWEEYKSFSNQLYETRTNQIEEFIKALTSPEIKEEQRSWEAVIRDIRQTAKDYSFFHWSVEFPEVRNGFDVVLGNPPWDKPQFREDDFYSQYDSRYSKTASHSDKAKIRDRLNSSDYPWIRKRYESQKQKISNTSTYLKIVYSLAGGKAHSDLYRFFMVRNLDLLEPLQGVMSYLTPSNWATDSGGEQLRKYIWENKTLNFFYQFENNKKAIFKDVHASYKISVWQLRPFPMSSDYPIKTRFMERDLRLLAEPDKRAGIYSADLIRSLSPEKLAFMEIGNPQDIDFLKKVLSLFPVLKKSYLDFSQDINITNDRRILKENINLSDRFFLPVYEGKKIHQYNSLYKTFTYKVDSEDFENKKLSLEVKRIIDFISGELGLYDDKKLGRKSTINVVCKTLGVSNEKELSDLIEFDYKFPRLSFREVSRNTDTRTMIACVLPANTLASYTTWTSMPKYFFNSSLAQKNDLINRIFFLQAILNSLIVDRYIRFLVDKHVTKSLFKTIPLPQPTDEEIANSPDYSRLVTLSKTLSYHHNPVGFDFLKDQIEPQNWGETEEGKARTVDRLRAEIDALVAKIYGFNKAEMEEIINSFSSMNRKHPGYKVRVLEAMDSLEMNKN